MRVGTDTNGLPIHRCPTCKETTCGRGWNCGIGNKGKLYVENYESSSFHSEAEND